MIRMNLSETLFMHCSLHSDFPFETISITAFATPLISPFSTILPHSLPTIQGRQSYQITIAGIPQAIASAMTFAKSVFS